LRNSAAQVLLDFRAASEFLLEFVGALVGDVQVGVAQDRHLKVFLRLETGDMALAAAVDAKHGVADALVRAQHTVAGGKGGGLRGGKSRGGFQKSAALHEGFLLE
jgi:hypothetical protein